NALYAQGIRAFLEIGPASTLIDAGQQVLPEQSLLWLSSLRLQGDDWTQMLKTLAALYEKGYDINWKAFDEGYSRQKIALPTYPFERQRCWFQVEPQPTKLVTISAGAAASPVLGTRLRTALKQIIY